MKHEIKCVADAAQTNDCAQILADLCEAMLIIGHDGEYVHAEVAMSFELHERLSAWWQEECAW